MDWHETQNDGYLSLSEDRLRSPRLLWVDQCVQIINSYLSSRIVSDIIEINDFGCNVGHFCRGIQDISAKVNYCGYDISDTYLTIARKYFPQLVFQNLDVSGNIPPRSADISVISATLEHIVDSSLAINNILRSTRSLVIIRTLVGEHNILEHCLTKGAKKPYLIRQFSVEYLTSFAENMWRVNTLVDEATQGRVKFVCNNQTIPRRQMVLTFER